MSPIPSSSLSPLQQQIVQMAQELATKLEQTARQAPRGTTLDACESLLLDQGRQFLRNSLAATLQHEVDQAEKKKDPHESVAAAKPAATKEPVNGSSSRPSALSI